VNCFECGKFAEHRHHVVPQSKGGTKTIPLCISCHEKVHDMSLSRSALIKEAYLRLKKEGKKWGRKDKYSRDEIRALYLKGYSYTQVSKLLGCSRGTVQRFVKDIPKKPVNWFYNNPEMRKELEC
jgi:transposase-like protein